MNNNYLESKPRYEILDGLRGVEAIFVVVFHLFVTYIPIFCGRVVMPRRQVHHCEGWFLVVRIDSHLLSGNATSGRS